MQETTKTIVCLANSRKMSGLCTAGKEIINGSDYGKWIRPVSSRPTGEIDKHKQMFDGGGYPLPLDVISIPIISHQPHNYQQENYLIGEGPWEKKGTIDKKELQHMIDEVHGALWINGYSSFNGINDRIPESIANSLGSSLFLVQLDNLEISVDVEINKRKVRALFHLNDHEYGLVITDPIITSKGLEKDDGTYKVNASEIYMCISIGEPYNGYCYKLAASIIWYKLS